MKTFSDRWRQLDWDDIRLRINGKTAADVERALNASQLTRDDMMALLSPAASGYLEQLAQRAQRLTRQRFGNTVREGANKQVISSQVDSLIKISRIWADFFPANTSNQPI